MVKKRVFDAALMSAILYGSESWLAASAVKTANPVYLSCVKNLLGVRKTTPNELCLVETGLPSLREKLCEAQRRTLKQLIDERQQRQILLAGSTPHDSSERDAGRPAPRH